MRSVPDLPAEVRQLLLSCALVSQNAISLPPTDQAWKHQLSKTAPLLFTQASTFQIASEAREVFFSQNTMAIQLRWMGAGSPIDTRFGFDMGRLKGTFNSTVRHWIKKLQFNMECYGGPDHEFIATFISIPLNFPRIERIQLDLCNFRTPVLDSAGYLGWKLAEENANTLTYEQTKYQQLLNRAMGNRKCLVVLHRVCGSTGSKEMGRMWLEYAGEDTIKVGMETPHTSYMTLEVKRREGQDFMAGRLWRRMEKESQQWLDDLVFNTRMHQLVCQSGGREV